MLQMTENEGRVPKIQLCDHGAGKRVAIEMLEPDHEYLWGGGFHHNFK